MRLRPWGREVSGLKSLRWVSEPHRQYRQFVCQRGYLTTRYSAQEASVGPGVRGAGSEDLCNGCNYVMVSSEAGDGERWLRNQSGLDMRFQMEHDIRD